MPLCCKMTLLIERTKGDLNWQHTRCSGRATQCSPVISWFLAQAECWQKSSRRHTSVKYSLRFCTTWSSVSSSKPRGTCKHSRVWTMPMTSTTTLILTLPRLTIKPLLWSRSGAGKAFFVVIIFQGSWSDIWPWHWCIEEAVQFRGSPWHRFPGARWHFRLHIELGTVRQARLQWYQRSEFSLLTTFRVLWQPRWSMP